MVVMMIMIGKVVVVLSYFVVEDDGLAPTGLEITQTSIHYWLKGDSNLFDCERILMLLFWKQFWKSRWQWWYWMGSRAKTCNFLAAERLLWMRFDNQFIFDSLKEQWWYWMGVVATPENWDPYNIGSSQQGQVLEHISSRTERVKYSFKLLKICT